MIYKASLGKEGENFATEHLKNNKYKIIDRNFRTRFGELDIIAFAPNKTLVFIEVKTMNIGELKPEDQMSASKLNKFKKIAQFYANANEELIDQKMGWRLDVIAIQKSGEGFSLRHYENIS